MKERARQPIKGIMTIAQAAAAKGVSIQAVHGAIATEKIRATRVGKVWLIRDSELDRWQVWRHRPPRAGGGKE